MMTPEEIRKANAEAVKAYRLRRLNPDLKAAYEAEKARLAEEAEAKRPEHARTYFREYARKKREEATPEEKAAKLAYRKEWHAKNREKVNAHKKARRERAEVKAKEAEYAKNRRQDNPDKVYASTREWRKNNKEKVNASANRWYHLHKDKPEFKLTKSVRANLRHALRRLGVAKDETTNSLLGCTVGELKFYIESLFTEGMSWDLVGKGGIQIDHVIPLKAFDLSKPEERAKANHFTNLQPMWAKENIQKSDILPCGSRARDISIDALPELTQEAKDRIPEVVKKILSEEERRERTRKRAREWARKKNGTSDKYEEGPDGRRVRKHIQTPEEKAASRLKAIHKYEEKRRRSKAFTSTCAL